MTGMGSSARMVLVQALRSGKWPALKVLGTGENPALLNNGSVGIDLIELLGKGKIISC